APEELGLESRTGFRRAAGELLDQLPEGAGRLVIDLSATRAVDSARLGALMLVQRKAAERRLTVCLLGANEELRLLLVLPEPDLLVLDMRLAECHMLAMLQECRATQPRTPVSVSCAYVSIEPLMSILALGHSGYLVKPYNMDDHAARTDAVR